MEMLKKVMAGLLTLSVLVLYFPKIATAAQFRLLSKASDQSTMTKHQPKILATPEENIPVEQVAADKKKSKKWLWITLGALALVGVIAAAGGGGGGGGDGGGGGGGTSDTGDTGDVTVSW
jgi:hypothetical protein